MRPDRLEATHHHLCARGRSTAEQRAPAAMLAGSGKFGRRVTRLGAPPAPSARVFTDALAPAQRHPSAEDSVDLATASLDAPVREPAP